MMKKLLLLLLLIPIVSFGQDYNLISDLNYYSSEISKADSYISERCELDLYYPSEKKNFPTIIFFHGGGLKNGEKFIEETYNRLEELKSLIVSNKSSALIEVDGGVNKNNFENLKSLGADVLVAGSYIFNSSDYNAAIDFLK